MAKNKKGCAAETTTPHPNNTHILCYLGGAHKGWHHGTRDGREGSGNCHYRWPQYRKEWGDKTWASMTDDERNNAYVGLPLNQVSPSIESGSP